MFFSTMLISIGSTITSTSVSFEHFILGRIVTGAGGGGIFIVASIMAIQMTSPKRRGLYMGLANTAMTVGVSLGAVIAGALEPRIGWVSTFPLYALLPRTDPYHLETAIWHPSSPEFGRRLVSPVVYPSQPYLQKH
jgi:MFS family permease